MTVELDKLDEAARMLALTTESVGREMAWSDYEDARDAYGDARALKGHVGACKEGHKLDDPPYDIRFCGREIEDRETWYCERAPIKEQPVS